MNKSGWDYAEILTSCVTTDGVVVHSPGAVVLIREASPGFVIVKKHPNDAPAYEYHWFCNRFRLLSPLELLALQA